MGGEGKESIGNVRKSATATAGIEEGTSCEGLFVMERETGKRSRTMLLIEGSKVKSKTREKSTAQC